MTKNPRRIELEGPANFRDLGGYPTADGRHLRPGRVFRSDSVSHMSVADIAHVVDELGLLTVVDLRSPYEVETFGHGPLGDAGVTVHHLPIVDEVRADRIERPADAPPPGTMTVDEVYLGMLDRYGTRFAGVLRIIANPANQPVVFHCAAGKDRTGIVAALLLSVLGVDDGIVAADYALTEEHMEDLIARHRARAEAANEFAEVGQTYFRINAESMRAVLEALRDQYGSIEDYLVAQGLDPDSIGALRDDLIE
ncbi:MAG: protein tyrosine/serine phosphatase [Actinomycetia bacterium]|nr:protein tyrosine/serine phosphatase [Actinomycetes bacterium]